jgi:crotonobetainyl-CoA:carnitine CoA-transferase CaiB-like acyl-CoA transferase
MKKVLEGVKVIELTTYAAAPVTGRLLADFGANVIKIEQASGDPFREWGKQAYLPTKDEENPAFQMENANKRGVALDLKSEEGKEILYALLADANIFFTNTRMASLVKLGLTYEDLKQRFPRLIYGHISGFGMKGEDAAIPGYDITAFWARGGPIADFPMKGNAPMSAPYCVGDHASALAMVSGLCGALYKQAMTGEGDYILVSLFGTSVFLHAVLVLSSQEAYGDEWPKTRHGPMTPIGPTYICGDGEMVTLNVANYERDWPKFCECLGCEDLISDLRYNNPIAAKEPANSTYLVNRFSEVFFSRERAHWVQRLKEYDLPFGVAQHFREVSKDPMAWANGYIANFTYESGNTTVLPNTPVQFKENVAPVVTKAPGIGEHTREILLGLGYSESRIAELAEKKVVSLGRNL